MSDNVVVDVGTPAGPRPCVDVWQRLQTEQQNRLRDEQTEQQNRLRDEQNATYRKAEKLLQQKGEIDALIATAEGVRLEDAYAPFSKQAEFMITFDKLWDASTCITYTLSIVLSFVFVLFLFREWIWSLMSTTNKNSTDTVGEFIVLIVGVIIFTSGLSIVLFLIMILFVIHVIRFCTEDGRRYRTLSAERDTEMTNRRRVSQWFDDLRAYMTRGFIREQDGDLLLVKLDE